MKDIKSKKRVRDHGEVFTPPHIVKEMISLVPDYVWSDPSKIMLEPSCGTGNFVVEMIRKKISSGCTPLQAIETTFAVDILMDNVSTTRRRILDEIYDQIDDKGFRRAVCIIHYNIFKVTNTLETLEELENMPLYTDKKQKTNLRNLRKIPNFNFSKIEKLSTNFSIY